MRLLECLFCGMDGSSASIWPEFQPQAGLLRTPCASSDMLHDLMSRTSIAWQVVSSDLELEDYDPADIALALCRMTSYNIGHLAYLNAKRYDLKRIFFGGFFIRGHPYTMETISFAIKFWSKVGLTAANMEHAAVSMPAANSRHL